MNIFFPLNLICMVLQIVFVVGQVVLMKRDGVFR